MGKDPPRDQNGHKMVLIRFYMRPGMYQFLVQQAGRSPEGLTVPQLIKQIIAGSGYIPEVHEPPAGQPVSDVGEVAEEVE